VHRFEVVPTCGGKNRETREYQGVELPKTHCHARTYKRMHTIAHTMYPAHTHVNIRTKTSTHKLARTRSRSLLSTHTHTHTHTHSLTQTTPLTDFVRQLVCILSLFFFLSFSYTQSTHPLCLTDSFLPVIGTIVCLQIFNIEQLNYAAFQHQKASVPVKMCVSIHLCICQSIYTYTRIHTYKYIMRLMTEMLVQFLSFVVAATNRIQNIDAALLRRFERNSLSRSFYSTYQR